VVSDVSNHQYYLEKLSYILSIETKKPLLTGLVVFLAAAILTQFLAYQRYLISEEVDRKNIAEETNAVKSRLQNALSYSLSATKTLAFIIEEYGVPEDFDRVAQEILESNEYIDALEVTEGGKITHVYPLHGNEEAIGIDVFANSNTASQAYKAIDKRALFFNGPFKLQQGGVGLVGRLPVFKDDKFHGFSVVLIKLGTLLRAAGIDTVNNPNYAYQLSIVNPVTGEDEFFWSTPDEVNTRHSTYISVPDGEWKLNVMRKGYRSFYDAVIYSFLGLVLSFTAGFYARALARQPVKLNRLVQEKTRQLASSEKYFRSLIEKSTDAIVLFDRDGKVLYQSPRTENISGYSLPQIQSLDAWQLIHPEDREEEKRFINQLFLNPGAGLPKTIRVRHKNGHYIWLEGTFTNLLQDESVKAVVCNCQDISHRIEAEQKILLANKQSESIINSLPGIFYLYDRHGKFLRWNRNFEKVSGYTSEEISGMTPIDFFDDNEKVLLKEKIRTVFYKGQADVQANFFTKDRRKIPYYFNGCSATFNGMDYLIGMGIDITDRVKAEAAMRERTEEIQKLTGYLENVREEERTRIAREIHDELGQQLTGLKMDAAWINKKISGSADQNIPGRIATMISLIDETVKTVRRISSELRPGILDDLGLLPALEWQCQEFEKRTGIISKCHAGLDDYNFDKNLSTNIFRICQEALTNVARHSQATEVETFLTREDDFIKVTIKDNGIGFDMEEVKAKRSLGLVGMRERAMLFQAELAINSEKGKGTMIVLKAPILVKKQITV
jgi:PAS domain S-box-containing protein